MSDKDLQFIERALAHPWMFWVYCWKWPRIVRQACAEYDLLAKERDAARTAHAEAAKANKKVWEWIHVTHRLSTTPEAIRAIFAAGKRLSILLVFFVATNAFGQAPPYLRNQWTTNANPLALKVISTNGVHAATNVWELDFTNTASVTVSAVSNANKVMVSFTGSASSGSSSLTNALLHAGPTNGSVDALILTAGNGIDLSTSETNRVITATGQPASVNLTNWSNVGTNEYVRTNATDYINFNVKSFGARGDAKKITDARIVGSDSNVFSMTAGFTVADVGKSLWAVETATGLARMPLSTIIAFVNSTNVIVSTNATATLSSLSVVWGTDDSDAIRATRAAADGVFKGKIVLPAGGYVFSKVPFDLLSTGATNTVTIEGVGQDNTVFYPSPAFDFTTTSAGYGMLIRDGNANSLTARGFTLDGLYFGFSWVSTYPMSTLGGRDLFEDIRIENFKNCNAGWFVGGSHNDFFKILISNCDGAGFLLNQCQANLYGCVAQNSPNGNSVRVTGVSGSANGGQHVKWVGGVVDESILDGLRVDTSSDVTFIGTELFGPQGKYAALIETNCVVRFVGCELVPFGSSGDRSGLRVLTNASVYLEACRLDKSGSGLIVSNAGTIYDAGGNNFSGTLTGNPLRTRVNGLIMTDSSVSGPHYVHPTATGYGMRVATDRVDFWNAGSVAVTMNNGDEIGINGDGPIQFFNDTGISRKAAAALAIGTQTAGNIAGTVTTSNLFLAGYLNITNALYVGNGITNDALTASTVLAADATKEIVSIANAAGVLTNNGAGVLGWKPLSDFGAGDGIASIFTNNVLAGGPGLTELEFTNTATVTWAATTNAGRVTMSATSAGGGSGIATNDGTGWNTTFLTQTNHNQIVFTNGSKIGATAINTLTLTNANLMFSADNTFDVGASGANRPRDIHVGRNLIVNGISTSLQVPNGHVYIGQDQLYYIASRLSIASSGSSGILRIANEGQTSFDRIQFGGTTAAFPGLGRTNGHLVVVDATRANSTNSLFFGNTVDTTASTGMTMNRQTGRVRLSAGNQTYLVTNNLATANSIVTATVNSDDTTAVSVKAIPAAGLITLKANAATTADTDISFFISAP